MTPHLCGTAQYCDTQAQHSTTASRTQFRLLCCQPELIPESLAARMPQFTLRDPCRLLAWLGRTIHMSSIGQRRQGCSITQLSDRPPVPSCQLRCRERRHQPGACELLAVGRQGLFTMSLGSLVRGCHRSHFGSRYTSGLMRSAQAFFCHCRMLWQACSQHGEEQGPAFTRHARLDFPLPVALAIRRLQAITFSFSWIPFGDHPIKLERYRED